VLPFKTHRPTRRHYFLCVNFRPFSFFTRTDAVTSELGDRQSSHPVKTLLQYYGKSLEALPGVAYPGFRDNRSTLNTKAGLKKTTCAKINPV